MKATVLIVDDHPIVRLGLKSLIADQDDFEVCGEAASVEEALQLIRSLKPDLVIVDISLEQGRSGLDLIQQLPEKIKILACSYHDEKLFAERTLAAGARGYIEKKEAPDKMVTALRRIMMGDIYLSSQMAHRSSKWLAKRIEMRSPGVE